MKLKKGRSASGSGQVSKMKSLSKPPKTTLGGLRNVHFGARITGGGR